MSERHHHKLRALHEKVRNNPPRLIGWCCESCDEIFTPKGNYSDSAWGKNRAHQRRVAARGTR